MLPSICFFRNRRIFTLRYTNNKEKKSEEEDIEYSQRTSFTQNSRIFFNKKTKRKKKKNHSMDVQGTAGKSKSGRLILGKI